MSSRKLTAERPDSADVILEPQKESRVPRIEGFEKGATLLFDGCRGLRLDLSPSESH